MRAMWVLLLVGCPGNKDIPVAPEDTSLGDSTDTAPSTTAPIPATCEEMGLSVQAWDGSGGVGGLHRVAADFTLPTRAGDWVFSEQFQGCDTYLFLTTSPRQTEGYATALFDRDVRAMLDELPPNVHLFVIGEADRPKDVEEELDPIAENIQGKLENMGPDAVEHWTPRIHFVTKGLPRLDDWVASYLRSPGWGFGIDRFQRIRDIGSFANHERYNDTVGWFEPDLSQMTNEAIYYNFEADREAALEADGATVLRSFDNQWVDDAGWSGVQGSAEVVLPDADTMAGFDTLELDVSTTCGGDAEYGTCPAWDRLVHLYACDEFDEEINPHTDTLCQPQIAGVTEAPEVMGTCVVEGVGSLEACREDVDCEGVEPGLDTSDTGTSDTSDTSGVDTSGSVASGTATGGPTSTITGTFCEGYSPAVEGVEDVPADTLPCSCSRPDGTTLETTYSCNSEGTGYNDCPCRCNTEVGRWITTYHREGRWVHDASYALPFFADGGTKKLAFYTIDPWEITVDFRLKNTGRGMRPVKTVPLFTGGGFDVAYNDVRPPIEVDVPASTRKAELSVVISGHGMASPGNCAEFCDTDHYFGVGGSDFHVNFPETANSTDCQERVAEGVVPNQYGTWFYGRSNWCPGLEVAPIVHDVTADVTPGETATFSYEAFYRGEPYPEGGASISLTTWVTFWE